jgi:hypothetical protein
MPKPRSVTLVMFLIALSSVVVTLNCCHRADLLPTSEVCAPTPDACAECHAEIYAEWQAGPHSRAFRSETFQALTNSAQAPGCSACHAPSTVLVAADALRERPSARDSGVDCFSCHFSQGKYWGPFEAPRAPHAVATNANFYRASQFCGACHRGTFEQWLAAPALIKVKQCQDCHLAAVTRRSAQKTPFTAFHPLRKARSHDASLRTVERFPDAFRFEIFRGDAASSPSIITVRLQNRLPHSIPTGDYGFRKGVMQVALVARDETKTTATQEKTFFRALGTAIPSFKEKEFEFTFPADAPTTPSAVAVTLYRISSEGKNKIVVAEEKIPFLEIKRKSEGETTKKQE